MPSASPTGTASRSAADAANRASTPPMRLLHPPQPVMARGIVGSRGERPTVASPLHKEVYDLGTGECFTDTALALRTYRTRVVGGMLEVELER